jgi:hypothetical protein
MSESEVIIFWRASVAAEGCMHLSGTTVLLMKKIAYYESFLFRRNVANIASYSHTKTMCIGFLEVVKESQLILT